VQEVLSVARGTPENFISEVALHLWQLPLVPNHRPICTLPLTISKDTNKIMNLPEKVGRRGSL
jgi:hypothetical protein